MKLKFVLLLFGFFSFNVSSLYTEDRRCSFYDLSKISRGLRQAKSNILIFYSSADNIGNRLPALGIAKMLNRPMPDVWCVHDKKIDFNFINKNYKCVIVPGGLIGKPFEHFWKQLLQCKIPIILWGQGGLFPDKDGVNQGMNKDVIAAVAKKCSLVNIRDEFTRDHYGFKNAFIAHCPTIVYLEDFRKYVSKNPKYTIFITHNENVKQSETKALIDLIRKYIKNLIVIDNYQSKKFGLYDILFEYYCNAELVISSKLHAGIIAYSLGIPYIMFARDEKQRDFQREHLNGICVENLGELEEKLKNIDSIQVTEPLKTEPILEFGKIAKAFIETL